VFATCLTAFPFGANFYKYIVGRGILSMKLHWLGFVVENMIFGEYMSEYSSDGDEKWVVREAKRKCFGHVLQRFRLVQIFTNIWLVPVEGFCE